MRLPAHSIAVLVVLAVSALACDEHPAATDTSSTPVASAAPAPTPPPAPPAAGAITGTVAETMDAGGYTYVRLTTAQGDQWAAIPQTKLTVGATISISNPMVMQNFESPTLKKTFDRILFGTLAGAPPPGGPSPSMAMPGAPTPSASAAPGAPVAKATGPDAHTVSEVIKGKDTLKDKPVTIHARVVKVNNGILGKNWLHVQDGTGSGADSDLLVTTPPGGASFAVGDVVTVKGPVHLNRDFGAGYSYAVMVEDATVTK